MMKIPALLAAGALALAPLAPSPQAARAGQNPDEPGRIEGRVTDAATGIPIPAVNVRILGTSRGTVSNADGQYRLPLEPGPLTIVFIHLSYESDTIAIAPGGPLPPGVTSEAVPGGAVLRFSPSLNAATLIYPEVVVLAEDPALEIIRKAIAGKRRWMDSLKTYRFEAYTRQVIDRDTSVASVTEAFTTGWVLSGDTLRERVVQKRQTANVPMEENFAAVRRLVNFNDDRITLFNVNVNNERRGFTFTGPTAPDALDNYDYRLVGTRRAKGIETYEIEMTPRTKLKPLFKGTIVIADRSYAVVGVDLVPNETFTLPFVKNIELRYRQQFALYDSIFWMPADVRIDGGFSVGVMGIGIPRVGFRQVSSIYNYELNIPVPDSVIGRRRVTEDSAAIAAYDSAYWGSNLVVPLTAEETKAYGTLDSTQTLEKQFRPRGVIGSFGGDDDSPGPGSLLGMIDARFTRVEGLLLGASIDIKPFAGATASAGAGYGVSDRRWQYTASASARPIPGMALTLGAEVYRRNGHVDDGGYYGKIVNSIAALFDKTDYFDYSREKGFTAWTEYSTGRRFLARLSFVAQDERSVPVETNFSLSSADRPFRPNPAITEGARRSFALTVRFGLEREALDLVTNNNLEITAERSSPSILESDFDYTRLSGLLTWSQPVFGGDLLFPASLRIRAFAGKGFGTLPPQRAFAADIRLFGYAPFGVLRAGLPREYAGDEVIVVALEQNFRSLPFLALNIPFLYRNGIELVVHGAFARSWNGGIAPPGGWHAEAGIGVSRILDILRIDLTRRFREPRRFFVTFSAASIL